MTVIRFVITCLVVGVATLVAAIAWVNFELRRSGPLEQPTVIEVKSGDSISRISRNLKEMKVIRGSFLLRIDARRRGIERSIHVGEFFIPESASISDVLDILEEGKVVQYPITVPEGKTSAQILQILDESDYLTGDTAELVVHEGTLLPSTYLFPKGTTRVAVVNRMKESQAVLVNDLWPKRFEDLPINNKEEAIILASIVEKESSHIDEMPLVAGVFIARLRRGMRLESDPTTIYGVSRGEPLYNKKGQRRTLYRSELRRKTDWNTYQIEGLPRTPICNPGKDAILAVLQPEVTDFLFFVADGEGGHSFARTLEEHEANVARYREYERDEINRERNMNP